MGYTAEQRRNIFDRGERRCHLCGHRLTFAGPWHVEHSRPLVRGGTNHGNNLRPACAECNLKKGVGSARDARAAFGHRLSVRSPKGRKTAGNDVVLVGLALGAVVWFGRTVGKQNDQS
jgi:5-methylcytosine-specific restriction endonuclease McrA